VNEVVAANSLDKLKEAIEESNSKLDKISYEIRQLEGYLKKSPFDRFEKRYDGGRGLAWDNKRLTFIRFHEQTGQEYFRRPLIECKAQDRLAMKDYIDDFIFNIIEKNKDS